MIAIIPARGGSKGLPGKNIKLLNGKPLIAYTIEAALFSKKFSRIIVNTDDLEIAKIAMQYGAEVPFMRPQYLATDGAKSIDVLKHTIDYLQKHDHINIDVLTILQPTSPLRTSEDIIEAIDIFTNKNADSVISYCQEHHPIVWNKYINNDGKFENIFEENLDNRQEVKSSYYPNGAIYILKKKLILENQYYTENSYPYIMPRNKSIDIDTIEDFEHCAYIMMKNNTLHGK